MKDEIWRKLYGRVSGRVGGSIGGMEVVGGVAWMSGLMEVYTR